MRICRFPPSVPRRAAAVRTDRPRPWRIPRRLPATRRLPKRLSSSNPPPGGIPVPSAPACAVTSGPGNSRLRSSAILASAHAAGPLGERFRIGPVALTLLEWPLDMVRHNEGGEPLLSFGRHGKRLDDIGTLLHQRFAFGGIRRDGLQLHARG